LKNKLMVDFKEALKEYKEANCLEIYPEIGIIEAVLNIEEWGKFSDWEKIEHRGKQFKKKKYYLKDFSEDNKYILSLTYEGLIVDISTILMEYIDKYEKNDIGNNLINRLYILFCCEIKLLNRDISITKINHIPFRVIEPLFEQITDNYLKLEFNLDDIIEKYKKLLSLTEEVKKLL